MKRTPQDRAAEALEVADRKVRAIEARQVKNDEAGIQIESDLSAAKKALNYAALHPALVGQDRLPVQSESQPVDGSGNLILPPTD